MNDNGHISFGYLPLMKNHNITFSSWFECVFHQHNIKIKIIILIHLNIEYQQVICPWLEYYVCFLLLLLSFSKLWFINIFFLFYTKRCEIKTKTNNNNNENRVVKSKNNNIECITKWDTCVLFHFALTVLMLGFFSIFVPLTLKRQILQKKIG